jgi:hypothetical protein
MGHDFWIAVDPPAPAVGSTGRVIVAGGHYFPRSSIQLADRLVGSFTVASPGGATATVATVFSGEAREGRLALPGVGAHVFRLAIKKPQADDAEAWATAIVHTAGAGPDDPARYRTGSGLEVVPLLGLDGAKPGDSVSLGVFRDGQPMTAKLTVTPEKGRTAWLDAEPATPARLELKTAGWYLVTATAGGRTATLTFHIREASP